MQSILIVITLPADISHQSEQKILAFKANTQQYLSDLPAESILSENVFLVTNEKPFSIVQKILMNAEKFNLKYKLTYIDQPLNWFKS